MEFCFENDIVLCRLPSHTSDKLQPCDVGVFGPLKTAYRNQVERFCQGGVNTIGKQHFTYLYSPARERALTKKNILAGWRGKESIAHWIESLLRTVTDTRLGSGLFPFNPDRVLTNMPKPLNESTNLKADNIAAKSCQQYEPLRTPLTPASPGALNSLLNKIKQVPDDEMNRQHKQRLQQKVNNAAQLFLAKNALLEDRNCFLTTINDESKIRRSSRSEILGKARVMSYEDLEKARADRAVKEAAKEAKKADTVGKRRYKRQCKNFEHTDMLEPEAQMARTDEVLIEGDEIPPKPWRAPVARMW